MTSDSGVPARQIPMPGKPLWAFRPLGDCNMQRISLAWFSQLGAILSPLKNWDAEKPITIFDLHRARDYLQVIADEKVYPLALKASRPVIRDLLYNQIIPLVNMTDANLQQQRLALARIDIWMLAYKLDTLLDAELAVQPTYHVWPKRAYDIELLVASGENIFSADARASFNEQEKYDAQQAGKCLAFEVPTAAAFHIGSPRRAGLAVEIDRGEEAGHQIPPLFQLGDAVERHFQAHPTAYDDLVQLGHLIVLGLAHGLNALV